MKEQILNEIAEKVMVNLAKHNVELTLVDDIKKQQELLTKRFLAEFDKIAKIRTELNKITSTISVINNEADKTYQQAINLMKKIDELGVSIPSDLNNSTKILFNQKDVAKTKIKDLQNAINSLT
jgi:uncharacterized coiled-coil DUF342 family protein